MKTFIEFSSKYTSQHENAIEYFLIEIIKFAKISGIVSPTSISRAKIH